MPDRIALKKLTASDLTFFEHQFRHRNAGNQKSINLNADVFVRELYPAAPAIAPTMDDQFPLVLDMFGPGLKGPHRLARKIVKTGSYKNWRLNGEFVRNPDEDPTRFNVLQPDDLAVLIFKGEPVPNGADVFFISAHVAEDAGLHDQLISLLPGSRKTMITLNRGDLEAAIAAAGIPAGHPIEPFLSDPEFETALEDAAYGSEAATSAVRRRAGRRVSAADLAKVKQNAARVGRDGEGLVSFFLAARKAAGELLSVEWVSDDNAVSSYDFKVTEVGGKALQIEVKSTEGEFSRTIHISAAEMAEAAKSPERYDLYRIYLIDENGAKLKIAIDIRGFARQVLAGLSALPEGVRPDSFSVDPSALEWGSEFHIERREEPVEGED